VLFVITNKISGENLYELHRLDLTMVKCRLPTIFYQSTII